MNEVLSQLHARKSVRAFLDRPISPEARRAILEAACAAPTAGNQQLYTILDITDQAVKDTLADTCDHQPFIAQAPLVLLFCADCQKWYDAFAAGGCSPRRPGRATCGWPCPTPISPPRTPSPPHGAWASAPATSATFWSRWRPTGPCSACRSTWCPPPCWCLATPHSNSRSGKSPAAAPWSTSSTRTPTAAWSRPSWRLCWPTTPEPGPTVRGWTPSASASTTPISPARCPAPWPSTSSPFCRKNARSRFWLETGGGIAFSSLLR